MSYLGKEFTSICAHQENINLETAKVLFSPNLKFGIIYSPSAILCLDLNTKEVMSKLIFTSDERVSNVKITQSNALTFVKEKKMNLTEIVTMNFNGHSEYSELKLQQKIIEYESWLKGGIYYLFVIDSNYELMLFKDNQLYIKQNISKMLLVVNTHYKSIAKIEFIANCDMLLVITTQGDILSFRINDDVENMSQNPRFNFIEETQIASEREGNIEVDIVSVKQSWFICDNNNSNDLRMDVIKEEVEEQDDDMNDENPIQYNDNDHNRPKPNLLLTIICNVNRTDTVISFFDVQNGKLIQEKELMIRSKLCIDSFISKYCLNTFTTEGYSISNSNSKSMSKLKPQRNKTIIPMYLFVCLKIKNSFEFYYADLLDCFGKKIKKDNQQHKLEFLYLNSLTGDISNIQKISFINSITSLSKISLINSKPNSNGSSSHLSNLMKVNIKIFRRINEYECYITNEIISDQVPFLSEGDADDDEEDDDTDELFKGAYSTNVNQYLTFYFKERNSMDNISLYKTKVIHIISQDKLLVDTFNSTFDIRNCNIDPYLLLLIFNNSLLSIKKYLNTKDNYNYNQFLVSNDIAFETIKLVYSNLRKQIEKTIKDNEGLIDAIHTKGISYLKLMIEVMKCIRHRNAHPIGQPYIKETDIMTDEAIIIDSYIFDMEVVLMMIKIDYECLKNNFSNDLSQLFKAHDGYSYIDIINLDYRRLALAKNQSFNESKQTIKGLREIFVNYFGKCSIESLIEYFLREKVLSSSFRGLVYYMKFILFNYYFYLVSLQTLPKGMILYSTEFRTLFNGILKEYDEYKGISFNLFELDTKKNGNSSSSFDPFAISQFLLKLNQLDIVHNKAFRELLSDDPTQTLNAAFIKTMINDEFIPEAYTISTSLSAYYLNYDEWVNHLFVLLKLKMFNVAWQTIINYFPTDFRTVQQSQISQCNLSEEQKIQSLKQLEKYLPMKSMLHFMFKYLIENEYLDILFTLPLSFIERDLLREFLESTKYEELLIVYYAKYRKVKEADKCFKDYLKKSSFGSESSKELYKHLIDSLFYLFGNETEKNQVKDSMIVDIKVNNNSLFVECDTNRERSSMISQNKEPSFIQSVKDNPMISKKIYSDAIMNEDKFEIKESFSSRQIGEERRDPMKESMNMSDSSFGAHYIHINPVKVKSSFVFTKK